MTAEKQTITKADVGKLEQEIPGIVSAVGTATTRRSSNKEMETAMSAAVTACLKKGITDPALHKEAMMAARDVVKKERAKRAQELAAATKLAAENEAKRRAAEAAKGAPQ